MKCILCGKEIKYGKSAFPFCNMEDYDTKCCEECEKIVLQAEYLLKNNGQVENIYDIDTETEIAIFYAKQSELPIKYASDTFQFLTGNVTNIDRETKKLIGTWGDFPLDCRTDNFVQI